MMSDLPQDEDFNEEFITENGTDSDQVKLISDDSDVSEPVVTNNLPIRGKLLSYVEDTEAPQTLILALVMTIIVLFSVFAFFPEGSRGTDLPGVVIGIDVIATIVFTIEYVLRLLTAPNIRAWLRSPMGIVDLLSFIPLYLEGFARAVFTGAALGRVARFLHVLRLVRFFKLFYYGFLYKRFIPYKKIMQSEEFKFVNKHKELLSHIWHETYEQIQAVIPISLYAILFQFIILGTVVGHLWVIFFGQISVILGLFLFLEGLKLSIMPIGEWVSGMLPRYIRLGFIMLAAFVLGIIVTYAEPAIGALAVLGGLVPRDHSPYLWYLLSEWTQPLTLFVGLGVGLAAALGVLRVRYSWTLRKLIFVSMVPCVLITFISVWALPELNVVIGLAWDCGAVTTGPVTVPVVLALGSGVANSMGAAENVASSTFGIVTLASLFPIVTVQLLAFLAYFSVTEQQILDLDMGETHNAADETPYRETINGFRAIAPAVIFFFALGRFVLKHKISELILNSVTPGRDTKQDSEFTIELSENYHKKDNATHGNEILEDIPDDDESEGPHATKQGQEKKKIKVFYVGVAAALVGMILFNYGITFGLAELGEQVGHALPGTFTNVTVIEDSPQYSYNTGIFLVALFAFVLGYLCTQAEPGLIVFGEKVEQLKIMPKKTLVVSVAAGVAAGMCFGVLKIVFKVDLIYFILISYSIALVMTYFSEEQIVCVAWDSAGVTTGEITVSFILVLGVSLADAADAVEGFGILTMASVGPIISVLASGFIEKYKRYKAGQS